MNKTQGNSRILSVVAFSLIFAYLLSFLFEGRVLYSLMDVFGVKPNQYILFAMTAHFIGLFTCGFFVKSPQSAKIILIGAVSACLPCTLPFFFRPSVFWLAGLIVAACVSGCAVAAWGHFLKAFTPKNERLKSCADVLIISNIIMIAINVVADSVSPFLGLTISMLCLVPGALLIWLLPVNPDLTARQDTANQLPVQLKKPLLVLFLFIAIITVNSGLMYQAINPAFEHLTGLVSWYWAVPYIIALAFMRNLRLEAKRPLFLYAAMFMMMAAFIAFMLLGRSAADYIITDTLMLGACGIFDLFWWSIIGEMLEHTENPVKVFGIGLSANVFGVICGGALGMLMTSAKLPEAEITVLALSVVCVTLVILPILNRQLIMLLKSHAYLNAYDRMDEKQQEAILLRTQLLDPLTECEQEVLQLILLGKSNKEIAADLFITENTVKTHAHNIYSKYDVTSRAELISTLLEIKRTHGEICIKTCSAGLSSERMSPFSMKSTFRCMTHTATRL